MKIVTPQVHHWPDERDNVGGIETSAAQGDLGKELVEGHSILVGGGIFEREDSGLFGDGLEEEAAESLDGFGEALPFELGHVEQFGFASNSTGGIALDGRVVRWYRDGKAVKGVAPVSVVLGVVIQKARETVLAARDVDGLKEVGDGLGF